MQYSDYINAWNETHAKNILLMDGFVRMVNDAIPAQARSFFTRAGFETDSLPKMERMQERPDVAVVSFAGHRMHVGVRTIWKENDKAAFLGVFEFTLEKDDAPFHVVPFSENGEWYDRTIEGKLEKRSFLSQEGGIHRDEMMAFGDCLLGAIHALITKRLAVPSKAQ